LWYVGNLEILDEHPEQSLVETQGGTHFLLTRTGSDPGPRHKEQHSLAPVLGFNQPPSPILSGGNPPLRTKIQEHILPTMLHQPVAERDRFCVIRGRVAKENTRHAGASIIFIQTKNRRWILGVIAAARATSKGRTEK